MICCARLQGNTHRWPACNFCCKHCGLDDRACCTDAYSIACCLLRVARCVVCAAFVRCVVYAIYALLRPAHKPTASTAPRKSKSKGQSQSQAAKSGAPPPRRLQPATGHAGGPRTGGRLAIRNQVRRLSHARTHSRRRSSVKGKIILPNSVCLKLPQRSSAFFQMKSARVQTQSIIARTRRG